MKNIFLPFYVFIIALSGVMSWKTANANIYNDAYTKIRQIHIAPDMDKIEKRVKTCISTLKPETTDAYYANILHDQECLARETELWKLEQLWKMQTEVISVHYKGDDNDADFDNLTILDEIDEILFGGKTVKTDPVWASSKITGKYPAPPKESSDTLFIDGASAGSNDAVGDGSVSRYPDDDASIASNINNILPALGELLSVAHNHQATGFELFELPSKPNFKTAFSQFASIRPSLNPAADNLFLTHHNNPETKLPISNAEKNILRTSHCGEVNIADERIQYAELRAECYAMREAINETKNRNIRYRTASNQDIILSQTLNNALPILKEASKLVLNFTGNTAQNNIDIIKAVSKLANKPACK